MITKQIDIKCKFCDKTIGSIAVEDIKETIKGNINTLSGEYDYNKKIISELANPEFTVGMMPSEISNRSEALSKENFNIKSRIMTLEHDLSITHIPTDEEEMSNNNINDSRCDECMNQNGTYKEEIEVEKIDQMVNVPVVAEYFETDEVVEYVSQEEEIDTPVEENKITDDEEPIDVPIVAVDMEDISSQSKIIK